MKHGTKLIALLAVAAASSALADVPQCQRGAVRGPCRAVHQKADGAYVGTVLLIGGGGWHSSPSTTQGINDIFAGSFRALGWNTLTVEHTSGTPAHSGLPAPYGVAAGFLNVIAWYDLLKAAVDELYPGTPICVFGASSGGNFALLLGIARRDVECIIAEAPPTFLDPPNWPAEMANTYNIVLATFTDDVAQHRAYSPGHYSPEQLPAKVLIGHAPWETIVPVTQAHQFCNARVPGRCVVHEPSGQGTVPFTHALIDEASHAAWNEAKRGFMAQFVGSRTATQAAPPTPEQQSPTASAPGCHCGVSGFDSAALGLLSMAYLRCARRRS